MVIVFAEVGRGVPVPVDGLLEGFRRVALDGQVVGPVAVPNRSVSGVCKASRVITEPPTSTSSSTGDLSSLFGVGASGDMAMVDQGHVW